MGDEHATRWASSRPLSRWLRKARRGTAPAIVLGGSCNGLSFARSLGRRGIPVLMLETQPLLGIHTRYADVLLLKSVDEFESEWLELLEAAGSRLPVPGVLFSTSDHHSLLIARHASFLSRYFRFVLPDAEALAQIVNKRHQYEIAGAAGIPIPKVHFPASVEDAQRSAGQMEYPCLLKPYDSQAARTRVGGKLLAVDSAGQLVEEYRRLSAMDVPLMIQELIPGPDHDLLTYLAFWDSDGRERAWLVKRKIRQFPPQYGDGSVHEIVQSPQIAELSRKLLREFDYRGFVGVEFKIDPRDGTYRLIEINARTESSNQLAISAGVDFPWIAYQSLTGGEVATEPITPTRPDMRLINEEWDIQAFLALRRSGQITLGSWLKSIRGIQAKAFWAWDDPMPLLAGIGRFAQQKLLGILRWRA